MSDSAQYHALADQMLRLSTAATTPAERASYVELSKAWRELAREAAKVEAMRKAILTAPPAPTDDPKEPAA